ncbi:hypothetical protein KY290_005216 [Solanum tuberosum]|uniref:Uncharacterized protein n=1 Tax=Solanum tuberosum TaxID=4113 RepID=A0ABQ7WDG2_SOLTU|nr:hypothetical protein KY290_005216 [Solanum tuberosum]
MALTKKKVKFVLSKACEKSFQELNDKLTSASALLFGGITYMVFMLMSLPTTKACNVRSSKKDLNLRQRRWLELVNDYDMSVLCNPDKVNVVVDALSWLSMGSVSHIDDDKKELVRDVPRLARLGVRLVDSTIGSVMVHNGSKLSFVSDVKAKKDFDPTLVESKETMLKMFVEAFSQGIDEAHSSRYSIHPRDTKMYHDLQEVYWWNGMKKDIAKFVANYHSSIDMASFEALYGRRCRSPIGWFEVGKVSLIGSKLVHEAMEKVRLIRERLKTAQSRQKSYDDVRMRDLEFDVDYWVYFKILSLKGVMRFGKKGKFSSSYVGPYKILKRIGKVAYELDLPNYLVSVHPVFHVSLLNKCVGDPTSIVSLENLCIK